MLKPDFKDNINFELYYDSMQVDRSIMKKGEVIPIHHHSVKEGFLYFLSGQCLIKTYSCTQEDGRFLLRLASEKRCSVNDYVVVTSQYNVHSIEALEDCIILDAFAVDKEKRPFQNFLTLAGEVLDGFSVATPIPFEQVQLSERMLEAHFECYTEEQIAINKK